MPRLLIILIFTTLFGFTSSERVNVFKGSQYSRFITCKYDLINLSKMDRKHLRLIWKYSKKEGQWAKELTLEHTGESVEANGHTYYMIPIAKAWGYEDYLKFYARFENNKVYVVEQQLEKNPTGKCGEEVLLFDFSKRAPSCWYTEEKSGNTFSLSKIIYEGRIYNKALQDSLYLFTLGNITRCEYEGLGIKDKYAELSSHDHIKYFLKGFGVSKRYGLVGFEYEMKGRRACHCGIYN